MQCTTTRIGLHHYTCPKVKQSIISYRIISYHIITYQTNDRLRQHIQREENDTTTKRTETTRTYYYLFIYLWPFKNHVTWIGEGVWPSVTRSDKGEPQALCHTVEFSGHAHKRVPSVYAGIEIKPNDIGNRQAVPYSGPTYICLLYTSPSPRD